MGVSGYKYMLDEGFVANSTFNATNACYNPELDLMVDLPVNVQVFAAKLIFFSKVDCTSDVDCTTDPPVFHPNENEVALAVNDTSLKIKTFELLSI